MTEPRATPTAADVERAQDWMLRSIRYAGKGELKGVLDEQAQSIAQEFAEVRAEAVAHERERAARIAEEADEGRDVYLLAKCDAAEGDRLKESFTRPVAERSLLRRRLAAAIRAGESA